MKFSLQWKIFIAFGGATAILFGMGIFLIQSQITHTNLPLTKNLNQQLINAKADELGEWIDKRVSELRIITENEALIPIDNQKARSYMKRMDRLHKIDYESFAIVDLEGYAWVTNDTYINVSERPYFQRIQNEEVLFAISDPIFSHSNQEPIIVVIYKIFDEENNLVGYINGAIYLENFIKAGKEIQIYDGEAWLIDSKGDLFTTSGKPHKDFQKFNDAYENLEEDRMVLSSSISNTNGWSLGIDFSKSMMTADTDRLMNTILSLAILLLITFLIISWKLSKSIIKPILLLKKKMSKVGKGNFNISKEILRKDEIGILEEGFYQMIKEIYRLNILFKEESHQKRQAELQVLHAQIQPHFLYNTLDTLLYSIQEEEIQESIELIEALSTYYRIGLSKGEEMIPLEKELDHIESYLQILKARYGEELVYHIAYDEEVLECSILKLTYQPLVENAIIHGFKQKEGKPFKIHLCIRKREDYIETMIIDDGDAIPKEKLEKIQKSLKYETENSNKIGFGLYSTNRRIQLTYGKAYGIDFYRKDEKTIVRITHPRNIKKGRSSNVENINCRR